MRGFPAWILFAGVVFLTSLAAARAAPDTAPQYKCSMDGSGDGVKKRRCTDAEYKRNLIAQQAETRVVMAQQINEIIARVTSKADGDRCPESLEDTIKLEVDIALMGADIPMLSDVYIDAMIWAAVTRIAAAKQLQAADCRTLARDQYLYVIETFTGSAYAAYRQRAQIGIDDLRALPPATSQPTAP